ncbi:glycosyltransferase family 4 protein [Aquipuribacter sp. SD81]|uniref:glycosyltransferase family 4 protein n=1 Tax=Aquipuribacter sp. SD81 TaxID=3127703 RepID=UPI003018E937
MSAAAPPAGRLAVGLLCPYDLDVPGGVREQVLGLAGALAARGHRVEVLGPRSGPGAVAGVAEGVAVRDAGRVVAVPTNGSTARLAVGPAARAEAADWAADGGFDVVHVHEPVPPGIGHSALRRLARAGGSRPAVAATVHVSIAPGPAGRSRALRGAARHVGAVLRGVDVLSAVSEHARRTVVDHLGRSALVVPNGVDVGGWARTPRQRAGPPTAVVVGRADEPRKGVDVLLAAWPGVRSRVPGARLVVVGPRGGAAGGLPPGASAVGAVGEGEKRRLVAGADVLVAPHRGGESFGLVLVEAMSVGTAVVASDLPAFRDVLAGTGTLVPPGEPGALADAVVRVLLRGPARDRAAATRARDFDWPVVVERWEHAYDLAVRLRHDPDGRVLVAEELGRRAAAVRDLARAALAVGLHDDDGHVLRLLAEAGGLAREEAEAGRADGALALDAHNRATALCRDPRLPAVVRAGAVVATTRLREVREVVNDRARRGGRALVELDDADTTVRAPGAATGGPDPQPASWPVTA